MTTKGIDAKLSSAPQHESMEKENAGIVSKDIGAQFIAAYGERSFTSKEEMRLIRRIDLLLMPIMFISFGLQYLDKALLSCAAQFGIIQDLKLYDFTLVGKTPTLSLTKFSHVTLILYWGYFFGSFPAVYLAQRLPAAKCAAVAIMVWGVVTMSTAGVKTFFLGFCEAAVSPAFSLITAMWYKREEQPLRFAAWFASTGFGGLIGTIAAWGIGHISGSLHSWQYQYLILGAVTVIWGFVVLYFLPDNPLHCRFLSADERILAVERMRRGQTGIENPIFKPYQIKEALLDPKTWLLVLMTISIQMVNGAVSGFGSIIISGFGFNSLKSVLLTGALGAIVFVLLLVLGTYAVYVQNQRVNIILFACLPIIAGCAVMWKSSWANVGTPLAGFYLLGSFPVIYVMILSMMSANTGGHTKKAFTAGLIWAAYCAGNGISPLLVRSVEKAEHYPTLFTALLVFIGATFTFAVILRLYLLRMNKRRNERGLVCEDDAVRTGFEDMTDKENPNFRYSW